MGNDTRLIFDDNFYRLGAVMLSGKFAKLKSTHHDYYAELGYPIPPTGFTTATQYHEWIEKVKDNVTTDTPDSRLHDILRAFNLPIMHENIMAMKWSVFFGKQFGEDFPAIKGDISSKFAGTNREELWVRVYPWTKKADYEDYWSFIVELQKQMPDYRGKEKYQTTFARDYELYLLSLKASKLKVQGQSVLRTLLNMPEYSEFMRKYKNENTIDQLRSITARFNKLLSDISFS